MFDAQWSVFIVLVLTAAAIIIIGIEYRRCRKVYLCANCRFNNDQDCYKEERPYAQVCTSYREMPSESK